MSEENKKQRGGNHNPKGRKPLEIDLDKALELLALGVPVSRVASQLNVSRETLYKRLAAHKGESK